MIKFRQRKKNAKKSVKNKFKIGSVYVHSDLNDDDPDMLVKFMGTYFDDKAELCYHVFHRPVEDTWNLTMGAWHECSDSIKLN